MLREARWDHGAVIDGWRNKVEHGDSLVPRVFDKSEAVRVMFSHPRGRVRELDEHDVFIETDLTRPTLRLWTRFAPRSMRDEIRAMYLKMHEEKHGDVVAKERAARAARAREHNGRRRHRPPPGGGRGGFPRDSTTPSVPGRKRHEACYLDSVLSSEQAEACGRVRLRPGAQTNQNLGRV